ncbi:MAG TPA: hybrid sensor histidine kinase/response regulator [Thermoanaerobaculia bacterium]
MSPLHPETERVLVRAPTGRDAALVSRILQEEGLRCIVCDGEEDFSRELDRGAGAVIVGQEALDRAAIARIVSRLETQPLWSDVPILVLTREAADGEGLVSALGPMVNVTLLERPVRIATLVSAVHAALRARRRQYEVRDLVDRLAESDRKKDEFLAMLGHELRNPLAAISTAVTLLREAATTPGSRERQATLIQRQVRHLARMVDDLLDLSRLSLGKITLRSEAVELHRVVRAAVETIDLAGMNGRHELSVSLAEEPLRVVGDPIRLEQVVMNLLQNALKYTPEGGHVELVLERRGPHAEIRVRDDGVGIPPEELPGIFDPFTQGGHGTSGSEGLGVGLYLTRHLVELHRGRIEAASGGRGRGAEFTVLLPIASGASLDDEARSLAAARAARTEAVEGPRNGEATVLLVEDNVGGREALEELLGLWGCEVVAVGTGSEAVERGLADAPALALIDIGLPDIDGYEVARRLRAGLGELCGRLVALTGFGQPDDRRRALEAGFDEHLIKPVDPRNLSVLLDEVCGPRAARRPPDEE